MRSNKLPIITDHIMRSKLDVSALIPVVEDIIATESAAMNAHRIIDNLPAYIESEYRVTQAEILLCILSRCHRSRL